MKMLVAIFLLCAHGLSFAETEADVRYIKAKVEAGEMLSAADIRLAEDINATTGSYIDIDLALERAKAFQAGVRETPRNGGNSLDNFGGPDAFGYSFKDNVAPDTATYDWIELRGDPEATWFTSWASYDDGCANTTGAIGFSFPFYGATYTTFTPTSNGWIEFGTCSPYSYYSCIPQSEWGPAVVPYAYDLHLQRGGDATGNNVVGYRNFGDYTVIEFDSIGYYSSTYTGSSLKYQIILYNTGRIKLQYNNIVLAGNPEIGTVGIQQPATAGYNLQYRCYSDGNGVMPISNGLAIWFYQPDGIPRPVTNLVGNQVAQDVVLTWTDPNQDINGNPIVVDSLVVRVGATRLGRVSAGVQTFTHLNAPQGNYTYAVIAYNDGFESAPATVGVVVGNPTYANDFEVDGGMWVSDGGWEWGTPSGVGPGGAHNGVNCWGTILSGNYANSACYNMDLDLGLVVQSPSASVEFYGWYSTETSFDGCHFKVSIDGGATWELVTPEGGYPQPSVFSNPCIGTDVPSWAGNSGGWQYFVIPVGQYAGEAPIFRFTFGSDGSVQYPGFYIDDMVIWGLGPSVKLLTPNGGEQWHIFSNDTVRWESHGHSGPVTIELNRDYPEGDWEMLMENTVNDGEEAIWVTDPLSEHCRVRVSALGDTLLDISDGDFSIVSSQGYLALVRPVTPTLPVLNWSASAECPDTFIEGLRFKNFGTEEIVVFQPLEPSSDEFSRTTTCGGYFALAPGQMSACTVAITFDPETDGTYLDTLLIQTDAINGVGGYVRIPLSGTQISTPQAPGIVITPEGGNARLAWEPVTQSIGDCPITVTHYLVFYSPTLEGTYYYHGFTPDTTYLHTGVIHYNYGMYYHVIATTEELPALQSLPGEGVLTEADVMERLRER